MLVLVYEEEGGIPILTRSVELVMIARHRASSRLGHLRFGAMSIVRFFLELRVVFMLSV